MYTHAAHLNLTCFLEPNALHGISARPDGACLAVLESPMAKPKPTVPPLLTWLLTCPSSVSCPCHLLLRSWASLQPGVMENIRQCKYSKPTPVQRHAIPISLANRDLMACAQTGSGKTAAFCLPIISGILAAGPPPDRPRFGRKVFPLALILSPTRELTSQVRGRESGSRSGRGRVGSAELWRP